MSNVLPQAVQPQGLGTVSGTGARCTHRPLSSAVLLGFQLLRIISVVTPFPGLRSQLGAHARKLQNAALTNGAALRSFTGARSAVGPAPRPGLGPLSERRLETGEQAISPSSPADPHTLSQPGVWDTPMAGPTWYSDCPRAG